MAFAPKLAVITGGSSGIGQAMALEVAKRGGRVAFCGTRESAIAETLHELSSISSGHFGQVINVSNRDQVFAFADAVRENCGIPDFLFNNAGVGGEWGKLFERPQVDWQWAFAINVFGVVYAIEAFVGDMVASQRPANILNTASIAGLLPGPSMGAYSPSKFAVVSLTEGLSIELADTQVDAAVLCPGFVNTNLLDSGRHLDEAPDRTAEHVDVANRRDAVREQMRNAMSPQEVVSRAIRGMESGARYIVTHNHFAEAYEARVRNVLAAFEDAKAFQL